MSEYLPFCPHNPCPICGDVSGNCSISEYGVTLACSTLHLPETKEGDLQGFWKCFRSNEQSSQWEDQRVRLRCLARLENLLDQICKKSALRGEAQ